MTLDSILVGPDVRPNLTFIFIAALDVRRLLVLTTSRHVPLPEKGIYCELTGLTLLLTLLSREVHLNSLVISPPIWLQSDHSVS